MTRLADMLRLWRTVNRKTVRDMEDELGLSFATISRFERGHTIDLGTWLKLQAWLLAEAPVPARSVGSSELAK